jgi:UDP-N-acetylglucosamine--N-acetylmuramyl-(pentapeptide) pyrophosphoryl-undecaprenol N-acetylglucosamine transferase
MSGGGTAGHIYPALTVAEQFAAEHDDVVFVGTPDGIESRLVPEAGVRFLGLPASGYDRSRPWTFVTSSLQIAWSVGRAWLWLGRERPDVVVGFGGYVSIPVGLAAIVRGIPLALHEQNSVPGLANRFLSNWASVVCVTYGESVDHLAHPQRAVVTGNPVREDVLASSRARGRRRFGVHDSDVFLLVFGGSRGARHLNIAIVGLHQRLMSVDGVKVVLVAGRAEADMVRSTLDASGGWLSDRFSVVDYLDDIGDAICAADLVVARAGATTIAEVTALGAACMLVPYPYATDDHQTKNARAMVEHGAAILLADSELDDQRFGDELLLLLGDVERRASMAAASKSLGRPDAARQVAAVVAEICSDGASSPHRDRAT